MSASDIKDIESQLRRDEGDVLHVYQDHLGFWTIGIGRMVDERKGGGISEEESSYLFGNDVTTRETALEQRLPWFVELDVVRQGVLINMSFQMGVSGVLGFKNTLEMVRKGEYAEAAHAMLQSKWATQTPERAFRLSEQMRDGKWH